MLHLDYRCVPATLICEMKEFDNFFSKMNSKVTQQHSTKPVTQ